MDAVEELSALLSGGSRAVVIARRDVDLRNLSGENDLFVMKILEGSSAAGGRGGGFGERRIVRVVRFHCGGGSCEKLFETEDEGGVAGFEVPYHVARMPLILHDGTESMGYGVVDEELVRQLMTRAEQGSSP